MFKITIENLENGSYLVTVEKDNQVIINRAYQDLRDVISLIPVVFQPKVK